MEGDLCGAVVIARDEETRIESCLKSLCNQSINLYVVVVNDGSLDDTAGIASQYADLIVVLPRHDESWTGNSGIELVFQEKESRPVLNSR